MPFTRLEHKLPPPLVALCVGFLMWLAAHLTESVPLPFGVRVALAVVLACAGLGIAITGVVQFRRARTTTNPLHPEAASSLVRDGIYRFTRNPMYLGLMLILLGASLVGEYSLCSQAFGWTDDTLQTLARNSIDASFANADVKARLSEALSRWAGTPSSAP